MSPKRKVKSRIYSSGNSRSSTVGREDNKKIINESNQCPANVTDPPLKLKSKYSTDA